MQAVNVYLGNIPIFYHYNSSPLYFMKLDGR